MSTNSSTGGYLFPAPPQPLPANLTFKEFLQTVFVGVSGLDPTLVRPRWQMNPPKQPDVFTNWLAIGATQFTPDANAFIGTLPFTYASGFVEITCNPQVGDTLTINGITITFVSTLTSGNQVLIGATHLITIANLQTFLSTSILSNLILANYTLLSNVITITANDSGASGNSFTLGQSGQILLSGATLTGGGTQVNQMQRHEDVEVQCAFYGPQCEDYTSIVRDGFQIGQNLDALRSANMGFVGTSPALHVPDLINGRWVDRFEMTVEFRREILRSYPILTLVSVSGTIQAGLNQGTKTVAWTVNE